MVRAGNDLEVTASNIVSTKSTMLAATRNVNVIAGIDSSSQRNVREETKRGVMGAGIGFTIGTRMQSRDVDSQRQIASASTIGSVSGDVRIAAGNRYTQVGSDVLAPGGDIDIVAKTVSILAAQQASRIVTEDKLRQQGLTVSVSSPVLSAVQTIQQMSEAAAKTKDRRMKALAGATAGLSASNAVDAVIAGQGKTIDGKANQVATGPADPATGKTPTRDANAGEKAGGIDLSISLGASSNQARSEQISNTVRGSTVSAGGSVDITANGRSGDGNILIQGSDIKAGVNATLRASHLDQLALQLQQMWADVGPAGASSGLISSGNAAIGEKLKNELMELVFYFETHQRALKENDRLAAFFAIRRAGDLAQKLADLFGNIEGAVDKVMYRDPRFSWPSIPEGYQLPQKLLTAGADALKCMADSGIAGNGDVLMLWENTEGKIEVINKDSVDVIRKTFTDLAASIGVSIEDEHKILKENNQFE